MYEKLSKEEVFRKLTTMAPPDPEPENKDKDNSVSISTTSTTHLNPVIEFTLNGQEFICSKNGDIYRKMKTNYWKEIINKSNHAKGYNMILIKNKQYSRAKIILYAFDKINLNDKYINIYHLNKNKLDCSISNLSLLHV
uniref:HNH nuclease domain-containing protein n=1 Tax=Florenciella sp. virus SA2 TaxID=3240092 RepID=A0AB39JCS1_9VIRU